MENPEIGTEIEPKWNCNCNNGNPNCCMQTGPFVADQADFIS